MTQYLLNGLMRKSLFFCLYHNLLNSSTEEGEWLSGDFRDKVWRLKFGLVAIVFFFFTNEPGNCCLNHQAAEDSFGIFFFPPVTLCAVHAEQLRCGRQSHSLRPQRKLFFTASLLAGALAVAAAAAAVAVTTTAAPTAPVVRGGCPRPPPPLHLQPLTTPWPSHTPTYTFSGCPPGRGRRPDSCCLCQNWWAAAAPELLHPPSWSCTGTHQANGGRGFPGGDKWGPTWLRAGQKRRDGQRPCSVYSEMCPWLLIQVRLSLTFSILTGCWSCHFERFCPC